MKRAAIPGLLSFNGGFVDTAGFFVLQGLFTAHVTGNFVTLGTALVYGTHGIFAKLIALPEFMLVVIVARLLGGWFRTKDFDALLLLLGLEAVLLTAFFVLAVTLGPFPDSDTPAALLVGFAGIGAMAIQNAVQRVHFASMPPTTIMTGNTTQVVLDWVDLWRGETGSDRAALKARFGRTIRSMASFAGGCATAAAAYFWLGLWCLALPALLAIILVISSKSASISDLAPNQGAAAGGPASAAP
jgi:uncharacterized membrane protein YoaK (UPF0700 family)